MRADLRARLRSETTYLRKAGKKQPRARILIVCEDGKSSPPFFKDVHDRLRLTTAEVEVYGEECGSAPSSVVEFAISRAKANTKQGWAPDCVFCVVDVDGHTTLGKGRLRAADFNRARKRAEEGRIEYIVSCPCFERWYLLHFEPGDRPHASCDPLVKHVEKHLGPYQKGTFAGFDALWERVETALRNAKRLRESRKQNPNRNAYTDVDQVVDALRGVARG